MEDLPLSRIAALVPEFAVKDLPLGRTLMMMMMMMYIVHRCGASGSMCACHAAGSGSIPGRVKFPG